MSTVNPHALTDGQVIAVAKLLEAVTRDLSPPERVIVNAILEERERLVRSAIERARDCAAADVRAVWQTVKWADGFGSPYWEEPGIDDTSPAQAVGAVFKHLRETIVDLRRQLAATDFRPTGGASNARQMATVLGTGRPQCPTCGSKDPLTHPAVQFEGEVSVCKDPFHPLTVETITDDHIRDLRDRIHDRVSRGVDTKEDREAHAVCESALNGECHVARRREARARCANIINSRTGAGR